MSVEIMDTTKLCRYFPAEPHPEIFRESFLETINQLVSVCSVVIIEGPEGIGKTTLLSQFARRNSEHSISIFIQPITRSSYDPDQIRLDLLNQVNWILSQKEIENIEDINITEAWGKKKWELQRRAKNYRQTYFFIIDGLTEIPEEDFQYQEMILDLLPFESSDVFKFLISGDETKLSPKLRKTSYKPFQVSGFTLDEAHQVLADLQLDRDDINRLYQITKTPAFFDSLRRILSSGVPIQELLDDLPKTCPEAFEVEWKKVDSSNSDLLNLLGVIAFSRLELDIDDISLIVGVDKNKIIEWIKPLSFLILDERKLRLTYVNDHFRKFVSSRLSKLKSNVENKTIEFLQQKPNDPRSLTSLPILYNQTGKHKELLSFLSPSGFLEILDATQSLTYLSKISNYGALAAQRLNKEGDFVGFALNTSVFMQMVQSNVLGSEINALIALGEVSSAIALVEKAPSIEERFFLSSVLINAKQRHQLDIPDIEEKVKGLYRQIDLSKLGKRALDIAANLINVLPDLAFELVEKATDTEEDENALDKAYLKLSFYAYQNQEEGSVASDLMEKIQNRIKDPSLRNFCNTNFTILDYSATQIINEAKKAERASEKLFVLRSWLLNNRESEEAAEVVEFGLNVAISTTEYAPNARDYRVLSTPLPYIKDVEKLRTLINIFDGQKGTVERLGPIEDYVRLMLTLAVAEKKIDLVASRNRLEEIYLYISDIKSLETKCTCLARLSGALEQIDPDKIFEGIDSLHSLVEIELDKSVNELLLLSADHYEITKGVIRALAKTKPMKALKIAKALNSIERRNKAIGDLLRYYLEVPDKRLNLKVIQECYDQISTKYYKDIAYLDIITRLSATETLTDENKERTRFFITNLRDINNPIIRCNACTLALSLLRWYGQENEKYQRQITDLIESSWNEIDAQWEKINVGFKLVEGLKDFPQEARKYLDNVTRTRNEGKLISDATAHAYLLCAYLVLRAFSGLITQNLYNDEDLKRIFQAIDAVTSILDRTALYTELALRFKIREKEESFSKIVRQRIKPLIQNISQENNYQRQISIYIAAPALYLAHSFSALAMFDELSLELKDLALAKVAEFILFKRLTDEPYHEIRPALSPRLTYEDVIDVLTLAEKIDQDAFIFNLIHEIAEGVVKEKSKFSQQQKAEIARKIEEIIPRKFPNQKYICHDGYKLVSQAQVYKIKSSSHQSEWNALLENARMIDNIADRVFILAYIAETLPKKDPKRKENILEEAFSQIDLIPNVQDRIDRCEILASIATEFSPTLAKKYIRYAYKCGYNTNEADTTEQLRELIDLADKIDPELAASLASIADDDPARREARNTRELIIKRKLEVANLKDRILKSEVSSEEVLSQDNDLYISAAWQLLGSLNAGRIRAMRFETARNYTLRTLRLPLEQAYPIFAWLIQNGVSFYQNTPQASEYIRPLFEASIMSCNLILQISEKYFSLRPTPDFLSIKEDNERVSVIVEGFNPEKAREIIIQWLRANLSDYLFISDAYFGMEDLWILNEINAINPNCQVFILTSKEHAQQYQQPWEETYSNYWRLHISEQDPPPTEIVVIGLKSSGKSPIHDRWWITKNSGLRIGTSLHSLGETRISEITEMDKSEAKEREQFIRRFVIEKEKFYNGERIFYVTFSM